MSTIHEAKERAFANPLGTTQDLRLIVLFYRGISLIDGVTLYMGSSRRSTYRGTRYLSTIYPPERPNRRPAYTCSL